MNNSKSINELVNEAAISWQKGSHGSIQRTYVEGATFATDLTFERVVEALRNAQGRIGKGYFGPQIPNEFADYLEANRSIILGTTKTSEEI